MTAILSFLLVHWHTTVLVICSLLAVYYVYSNRHKLFQTKTYKRRSKL